MHKFYHISVYYCSKIMVNICSKVLTLRLYEEDVQKIYSQVEFVVKQINKGIVFYNILVITVAASLFLSYISLFFSPALSLFSHFIFSASLFLTLILRVTLHKLEKIINRGDFFKKSIGLKGGETSFFMKPYKYKLFTLKEIEPFFAYNPVKGLFSYGWDSVLSLLSRVSSGKGVFLRYWNLTPYIKEIIPIFKFLNFGVKLRNIAFITWVAALLIFQIGYKYFAPPLLGIGLGLLLTALPLHIAMEKGFSWIDENTPSEVKVLFQIKSFFPLFFIKPPFEYRLPTEENLKSFLEKIDILKILRNSGNSIKAATFLYSSYLKA